MVPPDAKKTQDPEVQALLDESGHVDEPCGATQYRALRRIFENPDNHVVVSFGGGALPGITGNLALARIIDELDLHKCVREVWGCSAGAIVACGWATGVSPQRITDIVKGLEKVGPVRVNKKALIKGVWDMMRKRPLPDGLLNVDNTREAIREGLRKDGSELFEDSAIPLRLVAVSDDGHARRIVFKEGPIADAVMASMCIPGVMEPVHAWNGDPHGYLDGSIVEKTPLTAVIDEYRRTGNSRQLVILCSHFTDAGRQSVPRGFLARLMHTFDRMEDMIWEQQLRQVRDDPGVKCIVVSPNIKFGSMFDIGWMDFNLLWSRREFKRQLSNSGLAGRFDAR